MKVAETFLVIRMVSVLVLVLVFVCSWLFGR
jgi:hypothetical protein